MFHADEVIGSADEGTQGDDQHVYELMTLTALDARIGQRGEVFLDRASAAIRAFQNLLAFMAALARRASDSSLNQDAIALSLHSAVKDTLTNGASSEWQ